MMTSVITVATLNTAPLMCNTIDANGVVAPYSILITNGASASIDLKRLGGDKAEPFEVSDFEQSEAGQPTFSAAVDGRKLEFRIWGGFHRPMSQIDAVDLEGDTKGLRFLSGTCSQTADFKPVEYEFVAPRYPMVDGRKVQNCFGATLDGRVFTFRASRMENGNSKVSFLWDEDEFEPQSVEVIPQPFPSIPRKEGIYKSWTAFDPANGQNSPSFVKEFSVNEETLSAAITYDFESLDEAEAPIMVARAHCGQFIVKRSG